MPKLWVKQGGTWKQVNQLYIKRSGSWISPTGGIIYQNGIGKTFYPDTTAVTITYTALGANTFTVPAGVQRLNVIVRGASGGTGGSYASGSAQASPGQDSTAGQLIQGNLQVSPGQVLTLQIGEGGKTGLQSWNSGTGGNGGTAASGYNGSNGTTNGAGGGGGGGGASVILSSTGSAIIVAAGGAGGQGAPAASGGAGGTGGGSNVVPSGCTSTTATNSVSTTNNSLPSATKTFSFYYSASYGTGGVGALSGVNSALTAVPDYSSAFTGIPTNNGNGTDFIITGTMKSGSGGFACYRTQAQQGGAFYAPGNSLNIYAGRTVTGVNTSGNGGSSFWLMGPDVYNNGNDGFIQISVVTNERYPLTFSSNANVTSIAITPALFSASYVTGKTDIVYTVAAGVQVAAADTTTAALIIAGFATGDTITVNNSGTIFGAGGARGANGGGDGNPNPTWAVGNPPTTLSPATSGYVNGTYPDIRGNFSNALYYQGIGRGANWPDFNFYSGGTGPANGSPGGNGGVAIYLQNVYASSITIVNQSTGLIVGGGGGGGGMAGNNRGGGAGGTGGYAISYTGTRPAVTLVNSTGGIVASGGGGAGGWGNRYEGEGHGGDYGAAGVAYHWTGAGSSPGGTAGIATNNTGTSIVNVAGTFVISPAA